MAAIARWAANAQFMSPSSTADLPTWQAVLADTLARHDDAQAAVVCLCAAWCGTCGDYRAVFEQAARAHPHTVFRWLDIEDEADALGDADVETFPTLLIGGAGGAVHFAGPVLPQAGQLTRLLQSLGL